MQKYSTLKLIYSLRQEKPVIQLIDESNEIYRYFLFHDLTLWYHFWEAIKDYPGFTDSDTIVCYLPPSASKAFKLVFQVLQERVSCFLLPANEAISDIHDLFLLLAQKKWEEVEAFLAMRKLANMLEENNDKE